MADFADGTKGCMSESDGENLKQQVHVPIRNILYNMKP